MKNQKPDYIINLENKLSDFFSVMNFHFFSGDGKKFFENKKLDCVYENGTVNVDGKYTWIEIIYKTKQNFYIYVKNIIDGDNSKSLLTIYYKTEQHNELIFFINQIIKQFRDATTNNRTIKN